MRNLVVFRKKVYNWLVVEPTPESKWVHLPQIYGGENKKYLSCHHPVLKLWVAWWFFGRFVSWEKGPQEPLGTRKINAYPP